MAPAPQLCAYCRQQAAAAPFTPFCSDRCKMADLGNWLSGNYSVPTVPTDLDEFEENLDALEADDESGQKPH